MAARRWALPVDFRNQNIHLGGDWLESTTRLPGLPLGIQTLDEHLQGGLPRRSVVEISSSGGMCRATHWAIAACVSAQREADARRSLQNLSSGQVSMRGWCAWLDPFESLLAEGFSQRGIDLSRLLVVRSPLSETARIAARIVQSRVFSVVVVDCVGVLGVRSPTSEKWIERCFEGKRGEHAVRRLAIAAEQNDCIVLLLTNSDNTRVQLPVALRVELERTNQAASLAAKAVQRSSAKFISDLAQPLCTASRVHEDNLRFRIAKDRSGRTSESLSWGMPALRRVSIRSGRVERSR